MAAGFDQLYSLNGPQALFCRAQGDYGAHYSMSPLNAARQAVQDCQFVGSPCPKSNDLPMRKCSGFISHQIAGEHDHAELYGLSWGPDGRCDNSFFSAAEYS